MVFRVKVNAWTYVVEHADKVVGLVVGILAQVQKKIRYSDEL